MDKIKEYIIEKTFSISNLQLEMEKFAVQNHVPIITRDSLDLLISLIKIKKPKQILEFGTAIGYSSIIMANYLDKDAKIITVERNQARYDQAISNIKKSGLEDKITVYHMEALEIKELIKDIQFDMVFIDAAKGQYRLFFDMIFEQVNPSGIIVSDNIFHKGMVCEKDKSKVIRRQRTIYNRMNDYLSFLKEENNRFYTCLIPIGDGMAITYKNERVINE